MYKKLPTIFLPIYFIIEKITGKKFVTIRSGLIFSESLVIDKNDMKVLSFFNSLCLKELNIKKKVGLSSYMINLIRGFISFLLRSLAEK